MNPFVRLILIYLTLLLFIPGYENTDTFTNNNQMLNLLQLITNHWKANPDIILYFEENGSNNNENNKNSSYSIINTLKNNLAKYSPHSFCISIKVIESIGKIFLNGSKNSFHPTKLEKLEVFATNLIHTDANQLFHIFILKNESDLVSCLKMINSIEGTMRQKSKSNNNYNSNASILPQIYIILINNNKTTTNTCISIDNNNGLLNSNVDQLQLQLQDEINYYQNYYLNLTKNLTLSNLILNSNVHLAFQNNFCTIKQKTSSSLSSSLSSSINELVTHNWMIFELYSLNKDKIQLNHIKYLQQFGNKIATRSNFQQIIIRAAAPEGNMTQGELNWSFDQNLNVSQISSGFGLEIFRCFQYALNFKMISVQTKGWASLKPGGGPNEWTDGMAKEVYADRADISLAKTSILPYRAASLSYLIPVHALILTAFFRQPSISTVRNVLLLPFEFNLWAGFIITWILIICSTQIIIMIRYKFIVVKKRTEPEIIVPNKKLTAKIHENENEEETEELKIWSQNNILWCFGAICQQGWYITPKSIQLKIILALGLFLGLIGYVGYSATMVSIFTTSTSSINSFEQLLRSSMKITIDTDNAVARMLSTKSSSTLNNLTYSTSASLLIQKVSSQGSNSTFINTILGQSKLLSSSSAFLTFPDKFYTTIESEYHKTNNYLCSTITSFSVSNVPFRSGLFVAKGSPYKEFFNAKMLTIFNSGLMKYYVHNYESTYTPICNSKINGNGDASTSIDGTNYEGIGINDLFSAYLILIFGIILSTSCLIMERFIMEFYNHCNL